MATATKRSYGSGRLFVRADSAGRETWYGSWRVGGRRVERRLGLKRRPSMADGLTRTQAEAELCRLMANTTVVAGAARRTVEEAGTAYIDHLEHALRGRFVDEPVELVPKAWRAWVGDEDGRVHRTRLELGLWFVARDALRAGRLFRPVRRRYADPAGFLVPSERWQGQRHELTVTFGRTLDADERLRQLELQQQEALRGLQDAVDAGDGVRLAAGRLELSRAPRRPPHRCRPATVAPAAPPRGVGRFENAKTVWRWQTPTASVSWSRSAPSSRRARRAGQGERTWRLIGSPRTRHAAAHRALRQTGGRGGRSGQVAG
jgi:hypothetical protein